MVCNLLEGKKGIDSLIDFTERMSPLGMRRLRSVQTIALRSSLT